MGSEHHQIKDRVREWAMEPPESHSLMTGGLSMPGLPGPHSVLTQSSEDEDLLLLVESRALITVTTRGSSDEGSGLIQ